MFKPPKARTLRQVSFEQIIPGMKLGDLLDLPDSGQYQVAYTDNDYDKFLKEFDRALDAGKVTHAALDTETTGLDLATDEAVGVSITWASRTGWYIPTILSDEVTRTPWADHIGPFLAERLLGNDEIVKIFHNSKFDAPMLGRMGFVITEQDNFADTMLMMYLLDESRGGEGEHALGEKARPLGYGLKQLAYEFVDPKAKIYETKLSAYMKNGKLKHSQVPLHLLGPYACSDTDFTFRLFHILKAKMDKQSPHLYALGKEIEFPVALLLSEMEQEGMPIDADHLPEVEADLTIQRDTAAAEINGHAGRYGVSRLKLNSNADMADLLYNRIGLPVLSMTKGGAPSVDKAVLARLTGQHLIIDAIKDYRKADKLLSAFTTGMRKLIVPHRSIPGGMVVRGTLFQTGTKTYRLSSARPNLQNLPADEVSGKIIRGLFKALQDFYIGAIDYSQLELRLAALLSQEPMLVRGFNAGYDGHSLTAWAAFEQECRALGCKNPGDIKKLAPKYRAAAKTLNFAILYGAEARTVAMNMSKTLNRNVTEEEAAAIIEQLWRGLPHVKEFRDEVWAFGKRHGYVENVFGYRRRLDDLTLSGGRGSESRLRRAQRQAFNFLIQGTAAIWVKLAMIRVARQFKERRMETKMIMQVHDELLFHIPERELTLAEKVITVSMIETPFDVNLPFPADFHVARSWGEIEK